MKKLRWILFGLFFMLSLSSVWTQQPTYKWMHHIDAPLNQIPTCVAYDLDGNSFQAGIYTGIVDFDPGPGSITLTANSNYNVYIAKYNTNGNIVWVKEFYSSTANGYINDIATDSLGNVYAVGRFEDTTDFDPGPGVHNLITGTASGYICKLDNNGEFVWVHWHNNSIYSSTCLSIDADMEGNIYYSGNYGGFADFDPGPGVTSLNTLSGDFDNYISRINADGSLGWVYDIEGSSLQPDALYKGTGLFVGARVYGTMDADPGPGTTMIIPTNETFYLSKFNTAGNFQWVKTFTGNDYAEIYTIEQNSTASNHIFIGGEFYGTYDFDPDSGTDTITTGENGATGDGFVCKLSENGVLIWAINFTAQDSNSHSTVNSISEDAYNNILISGQFEGDVDIDPGPGQHIISSSPNSINGFVVLLDQNSNYSWSYIFNERVNESCINLNQQIYIAGIIRDAQDFDPGPGNVITSPGIPGDWDAYMVSWNGCGIDDTVTISNGIFSATVWPHSTPVSYQWLHCNNGNAIIPGATQRQFTPTANGSYSVIIQDGICIDTSDCYTIMDIGIDETSDDQSISVFPNPASDFISFYSAHEIDKILVTDMTGKYILQTSDLSSKNAIDISFLSPGIYLFSFVFENGKQSIKQIIKY